MAIWQFQCNIIPCRNDITGLKYDEIISWKGVSQPTRSIDFLACEESWSKDIIQYGKTEETCIEFIYDKGMLEEMDCRLDLRNLTKQKLNSLIKYVKEIEGMFFVDGEMYPAEVEIMVEVMKRSKANRYCKNPLEYFLPLI